MLKKIIIYTLGFIVPPLMVGTLFMFSTISHLMVHKAPESPAGAKFPEKSSNLFGSKPKALILASNQGTEVTDLFGPYEFLSESGLFTVAVVAPEKILSPTTGEVSFYPDLSFKDSPQADLLVIPAVMDPKNQVILDWVKAQAAHAKLILSVCEGARVLAYAGLLHDKKATSHFIALPQIHEIDPTAHLMPGSRTVIDGNLITSAGVSASLDATLLAIEKWAGKEAAQNLASDLGYTPTPSDQGFSNPKLEFRDFIQVFLRAGYDWRKRDIGVALFPGISELSLAAALDTIPRLMNVTNFTFSERREPIHSKHGLLLVPSFSKQDAPTPSMILIPAGSTHASKELPTFSQMGAPVKSFYYSAPGKSFPQYLDMLLQMDIQRGDPSASKMIQFVSKLIEYPYPIEVRQGDEWKSFLWIWAALVGVGGVLLVWLLDYRITQRAKTGETSAVGVD